MMEDWAKPNNLCVWSKGFGINVDDFSLNIFSEVGEGPE
jgi:hypothetical protein